MASSSTVSLASASDYATAFNTINRSYWAGSVTLFPVQTFDGRKLWISGLAWAGAAGVRKATAPKIVNTFLIEQERSILPYAPAFYDANGYGHLLDSRQMRIIGGPYRVEPIAGISLRNALYLSVKVSSDFTSWSVTGDYYLIEIPLSVLQNGVAQISQSMKLPNDGSTYYGSQFVTFDANHVYMMGRQYDSVSQYYNLYWSRMPIHELNDFSKLTSKIEYFGYVNGKSTWSLNLSDAVPVLGGVGGWAPTWYTGNGNYNYLYSSGNIQCTLAQKTLQKSSEQVRSQSISVVNAVSPDPAATSFAVERLNRVPWANLSSGNQLGCYTVSQTSTAYDQSNPLFSRPRFFEFEQPAVAPI